MSAWTVKLSRLLLVNFLEGVTVKLKLIKTVVLQTESFRLYVYIFSFGCQAYPSGNLLTDI